MRSKKLLALLLTIVMMLGCLSPAAAAMRESTVTRPVYGTSTTDSESVDAGSGTVSNTVNGGVVPGSEAINSIDGESEATGAALTGNAWTITPIDDAPAGLSDLLRENGTDLDELEALEDVYDTDAQVTVFVVLEDEPLAAVYSSPAMTPDSVAQTFAQKQASIVSAIQREVDSTAQVITQFDYLTNSVVLSTKYGNLNKIAALDGVSSVFVSPVFYPASVSGDADKMTVSAGQMTNADDVWGLNNSGYTGAGMTIAILDTGLDLDHPSFAADPKESEDAWTVDSLQKQIEDNELPKPDEDGNTSKLNAVNRYKKGELTADTLYYSAKIPFRFNYATGTTDVSHNDGVGDHGTHVAGIAAANKVDGTGVVGMAPDAQIIAMKVFNSSGGANLYDFVAALEDCITLGVDVANLSLGSAAGFSETGYEEVDAIYNRIQDTGLIVNIAAGNEGTSAQGSLYGTGKALTSSIDNATVASPSTYANVMSIASVNNKLVMADYFSVGEEKVFYQPSVEYLYGYTDIGMEVLAGQTIDYVIVDGLGEAADFYDEDGNSLVEGKVAVIKRGEINFADKVANAEAAGAVAAIIWNSNDTDDIYSFGMTTSEEDGVYPGIPAVLILQSDGNMMAEAEVKTLTMSEDPAWRTDSHGGQMSSFSSWGVSADLRLLPDLSGIGGNVYSCFDGGYYGLMSGTSMATPQVCGVTALVKQYLKENEIEDDTLNSRELVEALMMSTANVVIDDESELPASPRQQGAGVVDALKAVTSEAYLTVNGGRPKAELGDDANGSFEFTFEIHNFGKNDKTYTLSSDLLCEDYDFVNEYEDKYFMAGWDTELDGTVSFKVDGEVTTTVSVKSGDTAEVTVTITVSKDGIKWIEKYFSNGNYVEGYIYLTDTAEEGGVNMSLPFMGFCGDWTEAPIFDSGYWYNNGFWAGSGLEGLNETVDAEEYYHVAWLNMGNSDNDWILGLNPYSSMQVGNDGNVIYSAENNVISPNGDGVMDKISDYYFSLLRNARYLWLTYTDEAGNVLNKQELEYLNKTMYNSNYGGTVPYVYSWYEKSDDLYDFTDEDGKPLADGTKVTITVSAALDYEDDEADDSITIPITIDTAKPEVVSVREVQYGDKLYLVVTLDEAHPATVALMNPAGTQLYDQVYDNTMTDNGDGTYTAMVDITGHGDDFMLVLGDYGYLESYYQVSRRESGGNDPAVIPNTLNAYQVYDLGIYYTYGWDYMFGWCEFDRETGAATMVNSDAYETYAINAAEYVDGYVFAVDANNNFLYMKAGLWNRNVIRNLGVNVVDMAFDDATDTMYVLVSDSNSDTYALATLDLSTGELKIVYDYYSKYFMPWAMTFVNGTLYCCKYYYGGLYQVDLETYAITAVTTEDGEAFQPTDSNGYSVSPMYGQSMTYSKADGKIYWLYCNSQTESSFITIDPETWTSSAVSLGTAEYVGAFTLEETDYQLPESTEITDLALDHNKALIAEGETVTLTASVLPWNTTAAADITWVSSDSDVATVKDGVVTGVGDGTAVITAWIGTRISATCTVRVIALGSEVHAYDYSADGDYGHWQTIDLKTMKPTDGAESEVEIMAADYNGHDGSIYGVDADKANTWRIDPESGKATQLGTFGKTVADMAYDYSTGIMYAVTDSDSYLYALDMHSGAMVKLANMNGLMLSALACDLYGTLYGITYEGELVMLSVYENQGGEGGGDEGGIMPLNEFDDDFDPGIGVDPGYGEGDGDGTLPKAVEFTFIGELKLAGEGVVYGHSLCYDHNNDVLIWSDTNGSTFHQIGLDSEIDEYFGDMVLFIDYDYDLGSVTTHTMPQYLGMYVIPDDGLIPELPEVKMESVTVSPMFLLVGQSAQPTMNVSPVNANVAYDYYYFFDMGYDENGSEAEVIDIDELEENGKVVAKKAGVAYVSFYVFDEDADLGSDEAEPIFGGYFQVTVKNPTTSTMRAFFGDVDAWVNLDQIDTLEPDLVTYVTDADGNTYFMYSAEYVDGVIYGYGFNDSVYDWESGFCFMSFDPESMSMNIIDRKALGFPFVYDLAFDYSSGTMYALAGSSDVVALYYVDLSDGSLIKACSLDDRMYLNMAVNADGDVFVISRAESFYDELSGMTVSGTSVLYYVDIESGELEPVLDTNVSSSKLSSLAYDYDTGYFYWTPLGGLYLIDLADYSCNKLGDTTGTYGGDYHALMLLTDEYPEVPDELKGVKMISDTVELHVGDTQSLDLFVQPSTIDAKIEWSSSDESVATVDEDGVVTAIGAGKAVITATVSAGDVTLTATCTVPVYGAGDYFLTYNVTDKGFSAIDRIDPTKVTNLTENETVSPVSAMAMLGDVIYAYDEEGNFFTTTVESGFQRTYLGSHGVDVSELKEEYPDTTVDYGWGTTAELHYEPQFTVQDMTVYGDKLLALGAVSLLTTQDVYYDGEFAYSDTNYNEPDNSCVIYEVDLATGNLTSFCLVPDPEDDTVTSLRVKALSAANEMYFYSTGRDYISVLHEGYTDGHPTPTADVVANLQNLAIYGEDSAVMAMTYDEVTGCLYLLHTENGRLYRLLTIDPNTATVEKSADFVGGSVYDEENWTYIADAFHGLVVVSGKEPTDTPDTPVDPVTPSNPSTPSTPSTPAKNELPFVDVVKGEWYYDAVKYVYEKGLMNGVGDGTHFAPDGDVTRAMVVQTLYRMAGSPAVSGSNGFTDLSNDWYLDAVQWAYANGITTGRTDTTFAPDEYVTREELATFFYRYAAFCGRDVSAHADLSGFVDVADLGDWALPAMSWANAEGLILGRDGNALAPKGNAARSELATILMRFCEK